MVVHHMSINRIFILILSLLIVVTASPVVAKVTATVDRTNIVVDETLTLTISKDGSSFFTDPDLEPLQKDFKVLGQNQQSSTKIINGSASSSVAWKITLAPRRSGKVTIPPLPVGKEKTNSLTIQVNAEAQTKTRVDNAPIFIETDVDERSVFVQSQVIYTLRIYWARDIQIMEPGAPNVTDALIEQLNDATFEKVVDGMPYRVFERRYAIFPQKSGVLTIPQMVIQVTVPTRQNRRNFFDPFGSRGETLKLRSESVEVDVREKPQEFPAAAVWLPSSGLAIKDEWGHDPNQLQVGESVTLSVSVTADGLLAEQLPPVELDEPDGVKPYQGKAEVENLNISTGIIGTRKESTALIPTRPGEIELPEIRIPWWDKMTQKVEYAVVPAKKLLVQGTVKEPKAKSSDVVQDNNAQAAPVAPMVQQSVDQTKSTVLIILCAVFASAWLVTLCLLLYTRRQMNEIAPGQARNAEKEREMKEREAFNSLASACKSNDPVKVRAFVMSWARAFWPNESIQTYADIERVVSDSDLVPLLNEIDSALYSHEKPHGDWQGNRLFEQVKKVRAGRERTKNDKSSLHRLYK